MSMLGQCYYHVAGTRLGHRAARRAVDVVRQLGALRQAQSPLECLELPHEAVAALMALWRKLHWTSQDGMMTPEERLAIFSLAYRAGVDGDFVELGCWKGLTTCYLAAACRARGSGCVRAVDTFEGTREFGTRYANIERYDGSTLRAFQEAVRRAGVHDRVIPCVGLTTEVGQAYHGEGVAFLLIDADHSYEGVKADFETWFPHVRPGGTIAFHDYTMPDAGVGAYIDREIVPRCDLTIVGEALPANVFAVIKRPAVQSD